MDLTQRHGRIASHFSASNGLGMRPGFYRLGNDRSCSIFFQWLPPFSGMSTSAPSITSLGGADRASCDAAGLPGIQFTLDWTEDKTRTHLSDMDRCERG